MTAVRPNRQEYIRLGVACVTDPGLMHVLERVAPNLGICPECSVDDFTHQEGCATAARVEECHDWLERPEGERPWELGAIVTFSGPEPANVIEVIEELKSQGLPL